MAKKPPIVVLVLIHSRPLSGRLRKALAEAPWCDVVGPGTDPLDAAPPDVIVIDGHSSAQLTTRQRNRIARGDTSIISIDDDALLDLAREPHVRLPADTPPHEVVLACHLAGEAARLRRRVRRLRTRVRKGHRERRRLSQLASSDPLTGLPNRRAWKRELHARLQEGAVEKGGECLAIVDLDRFKEVNDLRGYQAGDRLLTAAASFLRHAVRGGDFVARLGGDEFGILLGGVDETSAAAIVERVRVCVRDHLRIDAPNVGVSVGYVVFLPGTDIDHAALVAAADRALRDAKSGGRDRSAAAQAIVVA